MVALMHVVGDERVALTTTLARFEAALVKSDALGDDDVSIGAKRIREKTMAEEARLVAARVELKDATNSMAYYGIAVHGASAPLLGLSELTAPTSDEQGLSTQTPPPNTDWLSGPPHTAPTPQRDRRVDGSIETKTLLP